MRPLLRDCFFHKEPAIDISPRTPDDTVELRHLIRQAANARQRDRLRAVELAIAGESTPSIMRMLGRSRGFVQRWCYVYRDHGLDAVRAHSPPGRPTRLPPSRHEAFKRRVLAGPVAGVEGDGVCVLRGRDFIRILEDEFGVRYELSGVYELLHRLGLSVLAPRPQHRQSDPQAMTRWVERAPFLSAMCSANTPTSASPSGSRTRRGSANRAR
jgi:transposase